MKLSVLIPYRPDSEARTLIHGYTSRLWAQSGAEVVYSDDGVTEGPFSFSRAINRARKQATGDCFLSYSVDALPPAPDALANVTEILRTYPWAACWEGQHRFTEAQTEELFSGGPIPEPSGKVSRGIEALVAVRANVWDKLGGYDEGFVGWGPEDAAWYFALKAIYPAGWEIPCEGFFHTLHHPVVPRVMLQRNKELYWEYYQHTQDFSRWYFDTRHNSARPTQ